MTTQWTSTDNLPTGHTLTAGLDAAGHLHILHLDNHGEIAGSLHLPKTAPTTTPADTDVAASIMLDELQRAGLR